jgi:putative inorganic carbon (hco3(-)) transporter
MGLLVDPQADSPIAASAQAAASFAEDMREEGRGSPQDRCLQSCTVFTFAAVTGPAPKLGVIAVALLVAVAILARTARPRAWAMLGALLLAPVLLLDDIWSSPQLHFVHRHPLYAAVGAALALALVCAVAVLFARRPALLAPLTVLALPFRIPIETGSTTSNLLVPLYLVVAAGTLAWIVPVLIARGDADREVPARPSARWVERLLALIVVLYALQSTYSSDFEKALQQMVFFYVPFALLYCLLSRLEWTPALVRHCMQVLVVLALVFAGVGFIEYATKTLFLNPKLIAANDVHTYFTVNSVFFDPDIFGRFLALVMIALAALLLYPRETREQLGAVGVLAVLWGALVLTLSRSSLAALLVGLGTLGALRWRPARVVTVGVAVIAIGAAAIAISPKTFGLNQGLNNASSGRADLVTGGLHMFGDRPIWGFGPGSFVRVYRRQHPNTTTTLAASHTIAITIAAEQGVIGEVAYVALVIVALIALLRRARGDPVRAAIAAAFLALVFHTLLYADFLEDPITWTLLGIGAALAAAPRTHLAAKPVRAGNAAAVPA